MYDDMFIVQKRKNEKRDMEAFSFILLNVFTFECPSAFSTRQYLIFFRTCGLRTLVSERQHLSRASSLHKRPMNEANMRA